MGEFRTLISKFAVFIKFNEGSENYRARGGRKLVRSTGD